MKIAYSFFVLLMAITVAHAQHQSSLIGKTLDKHYYQKLEANSEEILHFSVDSIYVDTLILRDKSIIRFDVKSIFVVENAFVGQQCTLTSAGVDGIKFGAGGGDGSDLNCTMIFRELGSMIIDTHGGNGKYGARGMDGGKMGTQGNDGGSGKSGGNGGRGGNVKLVYLCDGFIPALNSNGSPPIQFLTDGGFGAEGGEGGSPGRPIRPYQGYGRQGKKGTNGIPGLNGTFVTEQMR